MQPHGIVLTAAKVRFPPLSTKSASGPEPNSTNQLVAAVQHSHCGHSCAVQHFSGWIVGQQTKGTFVYCLLFENMTKKKMGIE